jgi:hypothetical protein
MKCLKLLIKRLENIRLIHYKQKSEFNSIYSLLKKYDNDLNKLLKENELRKLSIKKLRKLKLKTLLKKK